MNTIGICKKFVMPLLFLVMGSAISYGQFSISAQIPASGIFTKNQLWNVLIINSSSKATDIKVQLTLQDPKSRQILLTGITNLITLAPGSKILQYQQMQPIQYNYPAGSVDHNPDGFLPVGIYQACYVLLEFSHASNELAEDCITLETEPMSPPILSSPEDQSNGDYFRPSFTWLPPTPAGMFFNLNYDFILSAVLPGQSPSDAIQYNTPVYSTGNLTQSFMQFPSGVQALDSGKTYAWQIVARDQVRYGVKSEIWSFTCKKDSSLAVNNNEPYIRISNQVSAPSFAYEGVVKIEYYHESGDFKIPVIIANIKSPDNILASFYQEVKAGQNFLVFDLNRKMKLKENECYEVRFRSNDQLYQMRFYPKYYKK